MTGCYSCFNELRPRVIASGSRRPGNEESPARRTDRARAVHGQREDTGHERQSPESSRRARPGEEAAEEAPSVQPRSAATDCRRAEKALGGGARRITLRTIAP